MYSILFFGDSLTAGYQLRASESFPSRIQDKLDGQNLPYKALNYGISGETTAGGRQRLAGVLARFERLEVFVLELGANDALRGIPVRETTQNLQYILDEVQRAHPQARRVLVGLEFPFDLGPLATLGGGRMGHYAQEFKSLFRQLSDKNEVDFVPFLLHGVIGQRHLNLPDGVHPNAEGQKLLANNVWQVLEGVLES
ncbi:arylesterase [Hymenobacter rubripertinctus]|uniref:Arylesterase n=1 Tax=Hymenobacter rubripertinctus TaxID=2029981 RepID=A0A418QK82_9BACT|nr:arylesterase [Hymenobacter rubripertinctus]RIY05551.1 arylesterase [Hymenobacter rubripertinctus]